MNHLYHTLSPLCFLAAFILLVLTFVSPTTIFHEQVSLLKVTVGTSPSNASTKRSVPVAHALSDSPHRIMRRSKSVTARAVNSSKTSLAAQSSGRHTLFFGPMGLCVKTGEVVACSSPSFTPIFLDTYDSLGLSASKQEILPQQFPLAPAALFLSLVLAAISLLSLFLSSLSMHASKKLAFLAKRQVTFRKAALGCTLASWVSGLAATGSFHVQLGKSASRWIQAGGVALLGIGLTQYYAAYALELLSLLSLLAETFTSR